MICSVALCRLRFPFVSLLAIPHSRSRRKCSISFSSDVSTQSEANYPDLWVSLDKMMKSADPTKNPSTHLQQITEKPKLVTRA